MEMHETLKKLRIEHNLTQENMAQKLMISRQAISRWEKGKTQPNIETLKIISKTFNVSINALLGSPRDLFCQVCGIPLTEDGCISRDAQGQFNENFCKWCFVDGTHQYHEDNFEELIEICATNILQEHPEYIENHVRRWLKEHLIQLNYWQDKNTHSD